MCQQKSDIIITTVQDLVKCLCFKTTRKGDKITIKAFISFFIAFIDIKE